MIKSIFELSTDGFKKFISSPYRVTEKMDLIYFKIEFSRSSQDVKIIRPVITDVDLVCNDMFSDIRSFAKKCEGIVYNDVVGCFGDCNIGFFYASVPETKVIKYPDNYDKLFIISDIQCNKDVDYDVLYDIFKDIASPIPVIADECSCGEDAISVFEKAKETGDKKDVCELISVMSGTSMTYSGLAVENIEGVVLSSGNRRYKITVNSTETNIGVVETKMCRDAVLSDFSHTVLSDAELVESAINSAHSYIEAICSLFVSYLDRTEFFRKMNMEPGDLLPPHVGYMGCLNLSMIKSDTAVLMCRYSELYSNVLRLLLHTFKGIHPEKLKCFSNDDYNRMLDLENKIQSKFLS